jgi:pimeloyl-ACP methyl ester carboxylesterase
MTTTRGYAEVLGVETYYETDGGGTPLLLLHGGFGGVSDFASQFPEFARHYKVIAFERHGHGHTADTDKPLSYGSMADQTVAFMDALKLGPCVLVGWSDGATVALLVAISRPDLVRSLVYVSQNYDQSGISPQARKWIESMTAESFRKDEPNLAKRYDEVSPDGPSHFAVVVDKTKNLWLKEPNITREELARISVPTLVMSADRDVIPVEHMAEIARSIKGAQLCVIPGTTHFLLSERPQLVNTVILDFLRATETAVDARS